MGHIWSVLCFCKENLTGTQPHSLVCVRSGCLCVPTAELSDYDRDHTAHEPNRLTLWLFTETAWRPCSGISHSEGFPLLSVLTQPVSCVHSGVEAGVVFFCFPTHHTHGIGHGMKPATWTVFIIINNLSSFLPPNQCLSPKWSL